MKQSILQIWKKDYQYIEEIEYKGIDEKDTTQQH